MNARIIVTSDALPGKMQEGTLDADDNIITWTSDNPKVDPSLRMTISKWYRKPTISSDEFRLQLTEVQKEKERHTTKMSNVEEPKAIAPQREHKKGTASTTREERPVQNSQKDPSSKAGSSTHQEPRQHEAAWRFCHTRQFEPPRDVEMSESAHPAQIEAEQVDPPAVKRLTRPPSIPELQWDTMQDIKNNPCRFYPGEDGEEAVHETLNYVLSSIDSRKEARFIIWQLITVLEDCTNWYDLDDNHQRCLADHHMTLLLEANLNWNYKLGQFRNELHRIGCVLRRLHEPGQDTRPLKNNIERMMLFKDEIAKMHKEYDKSKNNPKAELPKQTQSLVDEWTQEQWTNLEEPQPRGDLSSKPKSKISAPKPKAEEVDWGAMKSSLQKKYTAPGSPTVHKFHATATPDTEVRKRVEAVAKLDNIRQQWENGTVRQASNKTEAKKNFEAHIDKIRKSRVNSSVRQNAAEEEVGGDIEMPNNPDAPELDITNLSAEDCDLLMENIKLYKETGYQKVDNESLKDRWFQKTLLKMMSKPKSAAER